MKRIITRAIRTFQIGRVIPAAVLAALSLAVTQHSASAQTAAASSTSTSSSSASSTGASSTAPSQSSGMSTTTPVSSAPLSSANSVAGNSNLNQPTSSTTSTSLGSIAAPADSSSNGSTGTAASSTGATGVSGAPGGSQQTGSDANTSTPVFNLTQTIQSALKSSTELLIYQRDLDRDSAIVDQNAAAGRPTINSSDQYQHLDSPVAVAIPGGPPIVAEAQDKEFLAATASLPIDLSGQIRATVDVARLQRMSDLFQRNRIYNGRVLDAETYYFNLLRAEHQVDVAKSALQNANAQEVISLRQFNGGVGQKIDYLRAQTQAATAQQNLLAAQNSLQNAQNDFNDLLGRPLNAPVMAQDTPGVSTGLAVETDATDVSSVKETLPTFYTPQLAPLVGVDQGVVIAQRSRPELLADQVNLQASEKQITIARAGNYPTLSLSATGDYYPKTDFQTPRHSLGVFAVSVNIPIYDGGVTRDKIREARDNAENAQSTFGSDQTEVERQVREAFTNLQTTRQQIDAANSALQEAIAARQLAQLRYGNGVGLYLEVTDAESALTQAETAQVNAVYDFLTARARYENALGTPQLNPQI